MIEQGVDSDTRRQPLLAFAATTAERKILSSTFPNLRSVSLYGSYGTGHVTGVDARDLSRYSTSEFSGAFGILLFDYFSEHAKALSELFRVITPGGVLFTHIANYRLLDNDEPATVVQMIKPRPGYFDYVPGDLPSIKVGRKWLLKEMSRAGFDAEYITIEDELSGEKPGWFVGFKPKSPTSPSITSPKLTDSHRSIHVTRVDPAFGFKSVQLALSTPRFPEFAKYAEFSEHAFDVQTGQSSGAITAVQTGGVMISEDLGESWDYVDLPALKSVRIGNAFTVSNGNRIFQSFSTRAETTVPPEPTSIYLLDRNFRITDQSSPGVSPWHGTRSIDERDGVIMFAEYPTNSVKYLPDFAARQAELEPLCASSNIFRSTDGGKTWTSVFKKHWRDIRHFHTVAADPFAQGTWWASSGDRFNENWIWRSRDNGQTWTEAIDLDPQVHLSPRMKQYKQSVYRFTDLAILSDRLIWGSDDWLGSPALLNDQDVLLKERAGSRMFVAKRGDVLTARTIGYVGNPVRSIIDVGPAYIVTTEAKHQLLSRPQIFLLSKSEPYLCTEILTVDNFSSSPTGFTYSRASRAAKNGRFFSYRATADVFPNGPRILQWDISFS